MSTDNATWEDVYSTNKGRPRTVTDETFSATTARYVRMYETKRGAADRGYSLFDFMVLNDTGVTTTPVTEHSPVDQTIATGSFISCKNGIVQYSVSSGEHITLDIIDCRGRLVGVLVDGFRHAGRNNANIPAGIRPGLYVIRLTAGEKKLATMHISL